MFLSAGTLGGIFLIIGAYTLSRGYALWSLFFYFIADLCWIVLAVETGDIFGAVSIVVGITLSLITMLKMHLMKDTMILKKLEELEIKF